MPAAGSGLESWTGYHVLMLGLLSGRRRLLGSFSHPSCPSCSSATQASGLDTLIFNIVAPAALQCIFYTHIHVYFTALVDYFIVVCFLN